MTKISFEQNQQLAESVYTIYKSNYLNNKSLFKCVNTKENQQKIEQVAMKVGMSEGSAKNYSNRLFNLFNELNGYNFYNGLDPCPPKLKKAGEAVFNSLDFNIMPTISDDSLIEDLELRLIKANKLTPKEKQKRLESYDPVPKKVIVKSIGYIRNEHVILNVLERANGICEGCNSNAPFISKAKNGPYLEVHHIIQLSNDGEDSPKNAIALCPNCHRESHFGMFSGDLIKNFQLIVESKITLT